MTSVTIPDSVTSIGNYAFANCSNLKNIYITDMDAWCNISGIDNLMMYGPSTKNLYLNNELVTEVVLPDDMTAVGDAIFRGCSSLTSIIIPDGVTSIGDNNTIVAT